MTIRLDRPITRRRVLVGSAAAGTSAFLAACGSTVGDDGGGDTAPATPDSSPAEPSPETEPSTPATQAAAVSGALVLYNYADYVDPATYEAFTTANPEVEIVEAFYASEEEVSAKLRAGGTSEYDNIVVAGTTAAQLFEEGLLQEIDQSLIPNLSLVDPALIDQLYDPGATFSVPKNYGITGFGYDASVVTDPPTTWAEFYDALEAYAPNTLLLEGATATIGSALEALGYRLGEADDARIAEARDLLISRKPYIGNVSTANFYTLFGAGGPVVLGQAWNGDILRLRADRPELEFVIPQGPADAWTGVWAIPLEAPNPAASHAWINALLEPENATREMLWSFFPVSVPGAADVARTQNPAFDVPWITASSADLERLATPVLPPDVLRAYNDAYTQFQSA
jgi:spermidine/putrescine transport system substrate-binding protein